MRYIQAFLKKILFLQKCDATTKQNQKEYTKGYKKTPPIGGVLSESGSWGIRTPGTVNPYVSLANWWFQPLTQPSCWIHF